MDQRSVGSRIGRVVAATAVVLGIAATGQTDGTAITDVSIRRAQIARFAAFPDTSIDALCFSPDSDALACGTSDGRIVLFDVRGESPLREIRSRGAAITSLAFSPEGTLLASSDASGMVAVWDPSSGDRIWSTVEDAAVHEASFSPAGGLLIAVGDSPAVRIWEVGTWEPRPPIEGHTGPIYAFAISPEEDLIVTGAGDDDPTVRLWTFPAGEPLGDDLCEGRIHDIEYSPADRHVAISGTQPSVWLWEVDRAEFLHLIFGGRTPVPDVAYSRRGNALVMVEEGGTFRFQRVPSVYEQRAVRLGEPLTAVGFSGDGLFIACGSRTGTLFLLSVP